MPTAQAEEATVAETPVEPELPEWMITPGASFDLTMWSSEDPSSSQQTISVSRDEFVRIKRYLAHMRGYPMPEFQNVGVYVETEEDRENQNSIFLNHHRPGMGGF